MANRAHLALLLSSVADFNAWRKENPRELPDLSRANLSRKNLRGANLSNCDLTGANLSRCDLTDCALDGARLQKCDLTDAIGLPDVKTPLADLLRRSVSEFNARRRFLSDHGDGEDADLSEQDFSGYDLTGANLSYCNLTRTDFRKAVLRNVNFDEATLDGARFTDADVTGAAFGELDEIANDILLDLIRVGYTDLSDLDVSHQNLSGLDLTSCELERTDLSNCILDGVRIYGSQLGADGPDLSGSTGTLILVKE